MKQKIISFLSKIMLMASIAACTNSNNSQEKLEKMDDKPVFERIVIEETVMGKGLYLNDIKLYKKFREGTAMTFNEDELNKYLSAGKSYSFSLFGNNYDSGHYWIDILLNGKIEVEKVEISEWEVP
ncbi:hypothetical protein LVD17_15160 [Fulvivirga ulvae]|uniref:hypothetical protein n=1 Tax=Fulvivirga ulvae TaxID=2904245 RepID=UPI001F3F3C59|nr:hypothetical protein [Fulvivirga ulvae]UII29638.1 hypothetical protein LVD17_15160 [Fulvivirga ulvae]